MTIEPFYFVYFLSLSLATSASGLLYPVKVKLWMKSDKNGWNREPLSCPPTTTSSDEKRWNQEGPSYPVRGEFLWNFPDENGKIVKGFLSRKNKGWNMKMIPCVIEFFEGMSGGFYQLCVVHRKVHNFLYVPRFVFSLFDDLVKGT